MGEMVYPQDEPRAFFYGLQYHYQGFYTNAMAPVPAPKHLGKPIPFLGPDSTEVQVLTVSSCAKRLPDKKATVWFSPAGGLTCDDAPSARHWAKHGIGVRPWATVFPQTSPAPSSAVFNTSTDETASTNHPKPSLATKGSHFSKSRQLYCSPTLNLLAQKGMGY